MKTETIIFKVSETEKETYRQLARYEQANLSELFRQLARTRAQQVGLWPVEVKNGKKQTELVGS